MMADLDGAALEQLGIDLAQARVQPLHLQPPPPRQRPRHQAAYQRKCLQRHKHTSRCSLACRPLHASNTLHLLHRQGASNVHVAWPALILQGQHACRASNACGARQGAWYRYRLQANEGPCGGGRQRRWQGQLRRGGLHSDVHLLLWGPAAPGCLHTKPL